MPVFPSDEALEKLSIFDTPMSSEPMEAKEIIDMLHGYGSPATVAQTGGRYFGFVNGGAIPASLNAKWLSDIWDQNAVLYAASPISSKLEEVCEAWLKDLLTLPDKTVAGFVGGARPLLHCADLRPPDTDC